jgi:hypothetical protein
LPIALSWPLWLIGRPNQNQKRQHRDNKEQQITHGSSDGRPTCRNQTTGGPPVATSQPPPSVSKIRKTGPPTHFQGLFMFGIGLIEMIVLAAVVLIVALVVALTTTRRK